MFCLREYYFKESFFKMFIVIVGYCYGWILLWLDIVMVDYCDGWSL